MQTIDFACSFLTFRIDTLAKVPQTVSHPPPFSLNNARIQVECRCVVTETATGWSETFVLGANCKTERVGVERDIWTEPNADFVPVYSSTRFMNLKTYARTGIGVGNVSARQRCAVGPADGPDCQRLRRLRRCPCSNARHGC